MPSTLNADAQALPFPDRSFHAATFSFGLPNVADLVRALAAIIVVYSHADDLLDEHWPRFPGSSAMDGVDMFFVLSGFLIGNILIRLSYTTEIPWWRR